MFSISSICSKNLHFFLTYLTEYKYYVELQLKTDPSISFANIALIKYLF